MYEWLPGKQICTAADCYNPNLEIQWLLMHSTASMLTWMNTGPRSSLVDAVLCTAPSSVFIPTHVVPEKSMNHVNMALTTW